MFFTAAGFGGNGAMLLPGLVTSLGNFPEVRGMVTGMLKSVFFLCASLYTEWDVALHENTAPFLVLLALLPAAVALGCIPLLRHLPARRPPGKAAAAAEGLATRRTFFVASALTFTLALYMALTVLAQTEDPRAWLPLLPLSFGLMLGLLALYAAVPAAHAALRTGALAQAGDSAALLPAGRPPAEYGSAAEGAAAGEEAATAEGEHYVGDAANISLPACLARPDYWCIYSMYVINLAVGLTLSNNLAAIAASKGAPGVAAYVALSSVATCMGTLLGAHASEAALDAPLGLPRPFCVLPAFCLVAAGCLVVATGDAAALYAGVAVTMLGYGSNLSVLPAVLHERFGHRHYGSIWAFSQTAMVVASSLFATGLAARDYEAHASVDAAGLQTCLGISCFHTTFVTLAMLALLGACIAATLGRLLGPFYALLVQARTIAEPGGYFAALSFQRHTPQL